MNPIKATLLDDDKFSLLAIPFSGPIPSPNNRRGVDLDGQFFDERTDIKADWLPFRMVDWHHGADQTMKRETIAKADNLRMEEDGWWVDVWVQHGARRLDLIKRLAERGAQLFGSSETVAGVAKANKVTGHITLWPYWRQTLSTSPQNTHSILRPLKAALEDAVTDYSPSPSFWADLTASLDDLGSDLRSTSMGESGAKAGRVLSAVNEQALRKALDNLGLTVGELNAVLAKLNKENT